MGDFHKAANDTGGVETAARSRGDLTEQNGPANHVGKEWAYFSRCECLRVVLLATSCWPDRAEFRDGGHQDGLTNRNNDSANC